MSVNDDLERQRAARLAADTKTARALASGYGGSWQKIRQQLDGLLAEITAAKKRGDTVDLGWITRRGHIEEVASTSLTEIRVFAEFAKRTIDPAVMDAYRAGAVDAEALVRATVPPGLGWEPALPIDETVRMAESLRVGAPLSNLLDKLPRISAQVARDTLIQGVVLGRGTRQIAADMQQAFGGNLVRALRISRTETIGAYRRAANSRYQGNRNVLEGWVWVAALNSRTCAACIAQHGSFHPLDEAFASHPACRCAPAPQTRPWAELGFPDVPETRIDIESGETWFARQPATAQKQILGPGKHRAFVEGRITLADLVEPTDSPVWGAGIRERSLRDALVGPREVGIPRVPVPPAVQAVPASPSSFPWSTSIDEIPVGMPDYSSLSVDEWREVARQNLEHDRMLAHFDQRFGEVKFSGPQVAAFKRYQYGEANLRLFGEEWRGAGGVAKVEAELAELEKLAASGASGSVRAAKDAKKLAAALKTASADRTNIEAAFARGDLQSIGVPRTLYRGVSSYFDMFGDTPAAELIGRTIKSGAPTSTSFSQTMAERFTARGGGEMVIVRAEAAATQRGVWPRSISAGKYGYNDEMEFILGPDVDFRVRAVSTVKETRKRLLGPDYEVDVTYVDVDLP